MNDEQRTKADLIRELQRLREELSRLREERLRLQAIENLGNIAGDIAHEFNNLLMGVFCNIEMAESEIPADSEARVILGEAHGALENARRLTGQLLSSASGGDPVMTTVDLGELVRKTVALNLSGSNVQPEFDLPADLCPVKADEGQINQLLGNLTVNGMQAMPDGGVLHVSGANVSGADTDVPTGLSGKYVRISLRDEGAGIPGETLDKALDPHLSAEQGESGLGLAVARDIVTRHDGHLTLESTPNAGATFTMFLPIAPAYEEPASPEETRESETATLPPLRILLMDDQAVIRNTTASLLRKHGHHVETAADGRAAVTAYGEAMEGGSPFDIVIMDLTVTAGMGGQEAVLELLEMDPNARAIVASGYSSDPVLTDYGDYGFRGSLAKPFGTPELNREILRVMQIE